jgi:hypothetical protein
MLLVVTSVPSLNVENLVVHNAVIGAGHLADLAAATGEKGFKSVRFDYLEQLSDEAKQALGQFLAADVKVEYVSFRGCGLDDTFITANAAALQAGATEFKTEIDGKPWVQQAFPYQGKCLAWLRRDYQALAPDARQRFDRALAGTGCGPIFGMAD